MIVPSNSHGPPANDTERLFFLAGVVQGALDQDSRHEVHQSDGHLKINQKTMAFMIFHHEFDDGIHDG